MSHDDWVGGLEPRRMLSGTFASLSSRGTLSVIGTSRGDRIEVALVAQDVVAKVNGAAISFPKAQVKRIWVNGFRGSDRIANHTSLPSTLIGASGNDTLVGGSKTDLLDGGLGHDVADYSARTARLTINIELDAETDLTGGGGGAVGEGDRFLSINRVIGGAGDDRLGVVPGIVPTGTADYDEAFELRLELDGGPGNDDFESHPPGFLTTLLTLHGNSGNDGFGGHEQWGLTFAYGDSGNDFFFDEDDDGLNEFEMHGGSGIDQIAQSGYGLVRAVNDIENYSFFNHPSGEFFGNDLDNHITVDSAFIAVHGGGGNDVMEGFNDDGLDYTTYGYTFFGDDGNDTLIGSIAEDSLEGGKGNDHLLGNPGDDTIHGGSGADTLEGGRGHDQLFGESGDDLLIARDRLGDTLEGGEGFDRALRDDSSSIKDDVLHVESFV